MANRFIVSFTETSLGRFLRAVEVYLLIVHSLYTTFQAFSALPQASSKLTTSLDTKPLAEKFLVTDTLAYAYVNKTQGSHNQFRLVAPRTSQGKSRVSNLSWILPRRTLIGNEHELLGRDNESLREEVVVVDSKKAREDDDPLGTIAVAISPAMPQPQAPSLNSVSVSASKQRSGDRPFTAVSLSYYTMDQFSGEYNTSRSLNSNFFNLPKESELNPKPHIPDSDRPSIVQSPQGSITSIDELFRQQTELDKSIAALRLFSMQTDFPRIVTEPSDSAVSAVATRSRSTLTSNKTESLSNRSDFSLSVFPAPPIVPVDEVATKYPNEGARQNDGQKASSVAKGQKEKGKGSGLASLASAVPPSSPSNDDRDSKFNSAATQFDVTSFIGG